MSERVLSVLAIDDDLVSLKILSSTLKKCGYRVTTATKASEALAILNEHKDGFDIVLTDIMMPDMDGFKLLEIIRKINIPVIMISPDSDTKTVVKGVKSGAQDYFVKPVQLEDLKKLPEHVTKKPQSPEKSHEDEIPKIYETECDENGSPRKKCRKMRRRINWTADLHEKFMKAVGQIEAAKEPDSRVIPTKILQIMNEPSLTRENIASHLQKFRKGLAKKSESKGDENDEQNASSSPEHNHVATNCFEGNGQYEMSSASGSMNNSNRAFTYPVNQNCMLRPSNMFPQNYLHSSQMHPNAISSPMIRNVHGSQTLMPERRNSIPLNNVYSMPYFGSTQIPYPRSGSSFVSSHPNQYGLPLAEIAPYTQSPDAFTSNFQMHRGFPSQMVVQPPQVVSPLQHAPCSLQGHHDVLKENLNLAGQHDVQNVSFSQTENLNLDGENNGSSNIMCIKKNEFNGNGQAKRTEHTQQNPNRQVVDHQNSFILDDEIRALLQNGQDMVTIA